MKSYFLYIFISAAMVGTFLFESISGGCAMECCKRKENTCCPSETKSHNCGKKYVSCAEQYFQPKNILKFGHKNDLKRASSKMKSETKRLNT